MSLHDHDSVLDALGIYPPEIAVPLFSVSWAYSHFSTGVSIASPV